MEGRVDDLEEALRAAGVESERREEEFRTAETSHTAQVTQLRRALETQLEGLRSEVDQVTIRLIPVFT